MDKRKVFLVFVLGCIAVLGLLFVALKETHILPFISAFIKNPGQVGSIVPSSRFLATEMAQRIPVAQRSINVLEVGAGSGSFTNEIIKKLRSQDHLDVIEYHPDLCALLRTKLQAHTHVELHCVSILEWNPPYRYDAIVSSLPFNIFSAADVQRILDHYRALLAPGGTISYIEYFGTPGYAFLFYSQQQLENRKQTQKIVTQFRSEHEEEVVRVWLNIPPTYVYHLKSKEKLTN